MKKIICFLLPLLLCISLFACDLDNDLSENDASFSQNQGVGEDTNNTSNNNNKENTEDKQTDHVHSWLDATCSIPKTCRDCGATEGEPKEHNWVAATCTTPKTCSVCNTTEGQPTKHTWITANCTDPKTCAICKATEGKAKGHTWKEATCSDPKTCTVCGTTNGLTAGHNFSNGKCTMCGKADPDYKYETMVWIPTKGGTKYHTHAGCSNMDNPKQVTQSEAESRGFTPCKKCH